MELDNYGAHTEAQGTGSLRQGYHRRGTQCIGTRFMSTGHEGRGGEGPGVVTVLTPQVSTEHISSWLEAY